MKLTQKKIAELLGCSVATVSLALSHSERISPQTRKKVLDLAELGQYRPDLQARSLSTGRSKTIGLIVGSLRSPFHGLLATNVQACLRDRGYMGITIPAEIYGRGSDAVEALLSHQVDGILSVTLSDEEARRVRDAGIPLVVYGSVQGPGVFLDERAGACLATEHLLGLGRRRLVYLGHRGPGDARFEGFRDGLASVGLAVHPSSGVAVGDASLAASGAAAMGELLSAGAAIDGVVCRNDALAIGAMRALAEAGRSVPGDVAVVGFDDLEICASLPVSLTSVRVDVPRIAEDLVAALMDLLQEGPQGVAEFPAPRVSTPVLMVRESTVGRSPR
ncbi:MAG: LacI family DNA-binding transcriptional regulator [Spirochaetes bacterium]|nr:LacI family DNA-binding transcriptional regulator [Spirochaetota bacterium]